MPTRRGSRWVPPNPGINPRLTSGCPSRALSAAIFGQPDRVRYVITSTIQDFLKSSDIDVVSRRLTWTLTREGTTWRATPLVRSPFSDVEPALSPDGRWLAYVSDESGQPQVYVQPFPGPVTRHQISTSGGREPLWARDGRTLYYLVPRPPAIGGHAVMAVPVTSGTRLTWEKPKLLFHTQYGGITPVRGYDIAKDGRFLMALSEPVTITAATHLDIIQNWSTDLLKKVPARTRH